MVLHEIIRSRAIPAWLLLSTLISAQNVNLLAAAPACAQSCSVLTAALQTCQQDDVGAPIATIAACFCTQPQATALRSDTSICASSCTTSQEQADAMTWFTSFCDAPQTVTVAPVAAATTSASQAANTATATRTQANTQETETSTAYNTVLQDDGNNGSWWDQHARWIAMAIVLVVGFTLIIIGGVWWKRRAARKRNERGSLPSSAVWGPQQGHPSIDPLAASNSDMALNRDAEKYGGGQPTITRLPSDMSGALQPSGSQLGVERASSRNRSSSRKGAKKLKKLIGR